MDEDRTGYWMMVDAAFMTVDQWGRCNPENQTVAPGFGPDFAWDRSCSLDAPASSGAIIYTLRARHASRHTLFSRERLLCESWFLVQGSAWLDQDSGLSDDGYYLAKTTKL